MRPIDLGDQAHQVEAPAAASQSPEAGLDVAQIWVPTGLHGDD